MITYLYPLRIISYVDIIEILFLTLVIYHISVWLKKDLQKPLLLYFYGYCTIFALSSILQLATINSFLVIYTPLLFLFFIIIHQERLQKNFVALSRIRPAQKISRQWLDDLLQLSLKAINNNTQSIYYVIERHDSLAEFLSTPYRLNASLQKTILAMLLEHHSFDHNKTIWLTDDGSLHGYNGTFTSWLFDGSSESWYEAAQLISTKTDAIFFALLADNHQAIIIAHGKVVKPTTIENTQLILRQLLTSGAPSSTPSTQKGTINHEFFNKKIDRQQPSH